MTKCAAMMVQNGSSIESAAVDTGISTEQVRQAITYNTTTPIVKLVSIEAKLNRVSALCDEIIKLQECILAEL